MIYDMICYDIWYKIYDRIWYDIWYNIWYDIWYNIWYDMIWYDMIWYDMIWYDMIWYDMIWYDMIWCDMIYDMIWWYVIYLTAIGLTPGGRSTVHIYTQTIPRTTHSTQAMHRTIQFTNYVECGPCPVFARYNVGFPSQLRKKARINLSQDSRRMPVGKECVIILSTAAEIACCFH
jgi:hypothetical protein